MYGLNRAYLLIIVLTMDALKMNFKDETYDVVFDKATLDALTSSSNSMKDTAKYISEVYRVLKPNGTYICVSSSAPELRMDHLRQPGLNWDVKFVKIRKSFKIN